MSKQEYKKRYGEIEKVFDEFLGEMEKLKKEQAEVIGNFTMDLEKAKAEEIINKIKTPDNGQ